MVRLALGLSVAELLAIYWFRPTAIGADQLPHLEITSRARCRCPFVSSSLRSRVMDHTSFSLDQNVPDGLPGLEMIPRARIRCPFSSTALRCRVIHNTILTLDQNVADGLPGLEMIPRARIRAPFSSRALRCRVIGESGLALLTRRSHICTGVR